MLTLANLPADQKSTRIQGLLNRLFEEADSVIILTSDQREQVASLFEDALIAGSSNVDPVRLDEIFIDSAEKAEQSKFIVEQIQKAIPKVEPLFVLASKELTRLFINTIAQDEAKLIQQIQPSNQAIKLLLQIRLKIRNAELSHTGKATFLSLLRGYPACVTNPMRAQTYNELSNQINFNDLYQQHIDILQGQNYYQSAFKQRDETILFNQGLISSEIEKHIQIRAEYFEKVFPIPGLLSDLQALMSLHVDLNQLTNQLYILAMAATQNPLSEMPFYDDEIPAPSPAVTAAPLRLSRSRPANPELRYEESYANECRII